MTADAGEAMIDRVNLSSVPRERGILFTPADITAIFDNRKSMTRRIINPQPPVECEYIINGAQSHALCRSIKDNNLWVPPTAKSKDHRLPCPFGKPGDRLYVKEGFLYRLGGEAVIYRNSLHRFDAAGIGALFGGWKSPLFMPKWAARLWLEITGVRVERLGAITEEDARAEGVASVAEFIDLWKSINKTWEPTLWVWVLDYRRVDR